MAKRGRPRKPGKRYPAGRLIELQDHGTSELQTHRAIALGGEPFTELKTGRLDPGTKIAPEATGSPIDALAAGGRISNEVAASGRWLAKVYGDILPATTVQSQVGKFGAITGRAPDNGERDEFLNSQESKYDFAMRTLYRAHPRAPSVVGLVCITNVWIDAVQLAMSRGLSGVSSWPGRIRVDWEGLVAGLEALTTMNPRALADYRRPVFALRRSILI